MTIIRPRLNDFYRIALKQDEIDFVIPFIDEDIPFYVDPFLMCKSPSQQDSSLHLSMINSFNYLGHRFLKGDTGAVDILVNCSECTEVGLGTSKNKVGKRIGRKTAEDIFKLFQEIPQILNSGLVHIEEIQLFVDNIAEDRISDISANFVKSFLIDFTIEQSEKYKIPLQPVTVDCFNSRRNCFENEDTYLPINPDTNLPIIFVPKRWLRHSTYINYENYSKEYFTPKILKPGEKADRVKILNFNRHNYDLVKIYIESKERQKADCQNDPLFKQIPVLSVKRKLDTILKLPTGKTDNADKEYENNLCVLLATLLYPHLDFAKEQSRTESGVSIRDLIFYNNISDPFLKDIYESFECKQIVFELKNVNEINNDHIDQLNRYLKDSFGKFGVIFTRHTPPKKVLRNTVDLWSGQRKCILILTDSDLKLMCQVYESKNRTPIEVLKMKYVEFTRLLPN